MTSPAIAYLIVQASLFLLWTFMMFRMLWMIARRKRGLLEGGNISEQMGAFTGFFRDKANRGFLTRLAIVTLLLMAINIAGATLLGPT